MQNRDIKKDLEQLDIILKKQGISRRDAMKIMGLGGATFLMSGTETKASTSLEDSDAKGKILIIGGGLAGISTAARLTNSLSKSDITIIEPEKLSCSYQAGQPFVAVGLWTKKQIAYKRDDFIPKGVKIIKEKAVIFNPDNNTVKTDKGTVIHYDYMIVAAGLKLNYSAIQGLEASGEVYSSGNNKKLVSELNAVGACSIYTADGAESTWTHMQKFMAQTKKNAKQTIGVFTHPNTPIKCDSTSKQMMYLTNSKLEEIGARANADLYFYTDSSQMCSVKEYHNAIIDQFKAKSFKWNYRHNLIAIDGATKTATFNHHWEEKGEWDQNLEKVQVEYDFIHITPPMKAPDEIGKSEIGSSQGWVPVKKETLQHIKYPNIFALGDIADVPMGKTSGSVKEQYKIVVNNIISMMQGKESAIKTNPQYDGYTVCPLVTNIGTVMFAEFNWTNKPTPTMPLDPTKERYIWWLLKFYLLKPMTVYGMLSGRA